MTTTQPELANQFRRLASALDTAERTPGGPLRAQVVRGVLAGQIEHHIAALNGGGGKPDPCPEHPTYYAHNCGCCRSERIGADT